MSRRVRPNPRGTFSEKMAWAAEKLTMADVEDVIAELPGAEKLTDAQKAEVLDKARRRWTEAD